MANEERLIDANVLVIPKYKETGDPFVDGFHQGKIDALIEVMALAPTVDAVPVVHGRWVYNGRSDDYYCSNCFKQPISFRREMSCGIGELVEVCLSDYCPNCGAKMDGGNEDG